MPKETFFNLPGKKREQFIEETLKEFSSHSYQTASINRIIRNLGIARGSVYQYFNDKLHLWLYIQEYSQNIKLSYLKSVKREEYKTFWDYYRQLFIRGIDFDIEQPLCSRFLYNLGFRENCQILRPYLNNWKKIGKSFLEEMIEKEKLNGQINKDVPTDIIAHFLVTASVSIAELLEEKYKVDIDKNIQDGSPLYGYNRAEVISAANDLINLFEKALK